MPFLFLSVILIKLDFIMFNEDGEETAKGGSYQKTFYIPGFLPQIFFIDSFPPSPLKTEKILT